MNLNSLLEITEMIMPKNNRTFMVKNKKLLKI